MPRSYTTSYLGNSKLKGEGVNQTFTAHQFKEYQKCAEDPVYFITKFVKIVNVDKGEIPFDMWPFQKEMIQRFIQHRFTILKLPRQVGKSLALTTPILTSLYGWQTMADIKTGDYVFGSDGKPTLVTEAHDVLYDRECFAVRFDDDETIVADAEHLWTVENSDWAKPRTLTTKQLVPVLEKKQKNGSGIRIALGPAVEFENISLPIAPYVLGLWLGDGSRSGGQYTGAYADVQQINRVIEEAGFTVGTFCPSQGSSIAGAQTIRGLRTKLRKCGLLKNKHIPQEYLVASYADRLELLRGLMDSDGSCTNHNGVCEFYQKSEPLINSFRRLISSLGIKSTVSSKSIEGSIYYTVRFSTLIGVFRLPRKLSRQQATQGQRTIHNVYIQSITPVPSVPVKCISVAAKDNLYLAGETLIPTHNSITTCAYLLWTVLFKEQQNIAILGNKFKTSQKLLSDLKKAYMCLPPWMQQGVIEWNKGNIELENGCKIMASSTSSDAIRGNAFNLIFLDEFAFVPPHIADEFFDSVYPTITSGQSTKVIIVSTPKGMNHFHKMWIEANNPRDSKDPAIKWNGYEPFAVNWRDVPKPDDTGNRDEAWKKETIARSSLQLFTQEFECEFIGSSNTLIAPERLSAMSWGSPLKQYPMRYSSFQDGSQAYLDVHCEPIPGHQYVLCADVAGGKELDSSAFCIIDISGIPYEVCAKYRSDKISTLLYPDVIAQAGTKFNNAFILVETNDNDVAKTLQLDLEYENLITTTTKAKGTQVGGGFTKNVEFGLRTNKATKRIGCSNIKTLIESEKLIIKDYHIILELHSFIQNARGSYSAEEGQNDDLAMCLVNFGWLMNQKYFKELTDVNVYEQLKKDYDAAMEEDVVPFGFISSGTDSYADDDGYKL